MTTETYERLAVITSLRDPTKEYVISRQVKDGRLVCSCPHYIFRLRARGEECKHIRAYRREAHALPGIPEGAAMVMDSRTQVGRPVRATSAADAIVRRFYVLDFEEVTR